ncbi:MAG TPA: phage holin family protein [Bryobacteraceae bacterium]
MALENERRIGEILQDTVNDLSAITRSEINLAKTELKSEAADLMRVAPLFIVGVVLGLFALGYLLTAGLLALVIVIPPWAASLVIFALVALAGAAIVSAAKARLGTIKLKPERTIHTMKENAEWLKTQTR